MAISQDVLEALLKEVFSDADIKIEDLANDGDHYSVLVRSIAFQGKTRIQQHKMVYDALKGAMAADLHAIAIKTESL
jgi:stress-induced morphogen